MTKRTGGKINTHYGMSDYYKAYCKREDVDRLSYSKYSSIIADFNTAIIDMVLNDSFEYMLPHLNLELTVRKNLRKPQIKDGKLHNNVPIDFKKTMDLWGLILMLKRGELRLGIITNILWVMCLGSI